MDGPLTISAGLLIVAEHVFFHVLGGEAHHFYREFLERWREAAIDPATGLPRNHDLQEASEHALRETALLLVMELAGRLEPQKPWLPRIFEHVRAGRLFKVPLLEAGHDPQRQWVEALREAVGGKSFAELHDEVILNEDDVRHCFAGGDVCGALAPRIAELFMKWARHELQNCGGDEPSDFATLLTDGWVVGGGHDRKITASHVYGLFLREHLKRDPNVFRVLVADTLNGMRTKLDALGSNVGGELKELRAQVVALAAVAPTKLGFTAFEQWLEPQLGEIKDLFIGAQTQLDALARGQDELNRQQGETLVALATLRAELARGNSAAQPSLNEFAAHIASFERKLDYLIGGLPIQRFVLPDPPEHELQLLHAKHRAVYLTGRDTDLAALWNWLDTSTPISARLLVGGAGTGKTRLALELLLRVNGDLPDWQASLISGNDLLRLVERTHAPDFNWSAPTLLVVDYAQTLARPLADLLRALTHKRQAGLPPLRVLLLERQPGDWFDDLLREEESAGPCSVSKLFEPPTPISLTPLPLGQLRRQILQQMLHKTAVLNKKPPLKLPPEGNLEYDTSLQRDIFAQPLNLMLAALAAGELGLLPALTRSRIDLAEVLATRELARVARFARTPGNAAQERVSQHLAACATMERGFSMERLERAVTEELAALQINWPDGAGDLMAVLRRALPGGRLGVAPVEPDFVGESLVLLALAKADGGGANSWQKWCMTVERCCRRNPRATPATLLHAFQNFGQQPKYGEPLLAATDALIKAGLADAEPELLWGIERALPHQTVELRPRAAEVTRHLYTSFKNALNQGREELKPEVARLANNLGMRLCAMGRRADALAPAQEAVEFRRALVRQNSDAFQPGLADSLINFANVLSALERPSEALLAAEEAVALYRALEVKNSKRFKAALAGALTILANPLCALGRWTAALTSSQEGLKRWRELEKENPDVFLPNLAMSLNNVANRLSELGQWTEALDPAQEAVEIYRALARQNPDAFQSELAMSLNNLANRLKRLGQPREALVATDQAVELYRWLAQRNPNFFQRYLAGSLSNIAYLLDDLNQPTKALAAAQEAVEIGRALVLQDCEAFQLDLAMPLNTVSVLLSKFGRKAEALVPIQEATELYRALARRNPAGFSHYLAGALTNLAGYLFQTGRTADALASLQEAVEIFRGLSQENPKGFQPDLAGSLNNLGKLLRSLGRGEEALRPAQEAADVYRALAQENPNGFQSDFATSLHNLANVFSKLGRPSEALGPAQETVEIRRALVLKDPESSQQALATSLGELSNVLGCLKRHAEAATALAEGIRALQPYFAQSPEASAPLMTGLVRGYCKAAQAAQIEPDMLLPAPILEVLQLLQPGQPNRR